MGVLSLIGALLFPPKCVFCGRVLEKNEREARVCRACRRSIEYNEKVLPPSGALGEVCAPLVYSANVRKAMLRFKFRDRADFARPLAAFAADEVKRRFDGRYDIVTWAPVSRERLRERGYDQAMLLAEAVAVRLGTVAVSTLEKTRHTGPNSALGMSERAENVRGVYRATEPELVRGKRVLLIDDIVTTGSTMRECARTLRAAGAVEVLGAAVAAAGAEHHQGDEI